MIAGLIGCAQIPVFQSAGPDWLDERTGNLIAVKIRDVEEGRLQPEQIVLVETSWAALIVWNGGERRFHLFDNERHKYLSTDSWGGFLAALRSLPKGTPVQRFYKCSVPWEYEMPEVEWDRLERVMRARKLTWRELTDDELSTAIVCIHGGMKNDGLKFPPP